MSNEFEPQNRWSRFREKFSSNPFSSLTQSTSGLGSKIKWKDLASRVQSLDLQKFVDWVSKLAQDSSFAFYGKLGTIMVCSYFLADLSALVIGDYLPSPSTSGPKPKLSSSTTQGRQSSDYPSVVARNLFSSKGLIPGEDDQGGGADPNAMPVKTTLPLNLIGTLIMSNPLHSLATIEDKSASQIYPVGIDDEVPGKLKVQTIESRRVIFVNKMSGRKEYVELPEDPDGPRLPTRIGGGGMGGGNTAIERLAPSQFSVPRGEVDRALANFNKLLTDARAEPASDDGGLPAGFKITQIIPGSLYDKLGIQNGDVISGVNGQLINDPGKAFELFNELKNSNHMELQIKKNGKQLNYVYDIHP